MATYPSACVFFSPFPTIHSLGSKASSQSLLRRKRFSVVSRITNKCLLESVTVTQLLKQFPISNADGHISGPRSSFLTGLSVCTSTQCALQHIKISASCVWVTPLQPVVGQLQVKTVIPCRRPCGVPAVRMLQPARSSTFFAYRSGGEKRDTTLQFAAARLFIQVPCCCCS